MSKLQTQIRLLPLHCLDASTFFRIIEPRHDKTNQMHVRPRRPAKTQISMGIHPVWSESSLCTPLVDKDPRFLHADSEDSDQTGQMPRLIWVFAGRTAILLVLSCPGSYNYSNNVRCLNINKFMLPNIIIEPHHMKMCLWGFSTR